MSILKQIKYLAVEGNVVAVAIGVVLGTALCNVTTSLVSKILAPVFTAVWTYYFGADSLSVTFNIGTIPLVIQYGEFLKSIFDMLLAGLAIFCVVKYIYAIMHSFEPILKMCPYCCGSIPVKATKCKHCTSDLTTTNE